MVKRYDPTICYVAEGAGVADMEESDYGDYVDHGDYAALAERCERLEEALRKAAGMLVHLGSNHESPEKRAMAAELADLLSGSSGGKDG